MGQTTRLMFQVFYLEQQTLGVLYCRLWDFRRKVWWERSKWEPVKISIRNDVTNFRQPKNDSRKTISQIHFSVRNEKQL